MLMSLTLPKAAPRKLIEVPVKTNPRGSGRSQATGNAPLTSYECTETTVFPEITND